MLFLTGAHFEDNCGEHNRYAEVKQEKKKEQEDVSSIY
jgi:hypothetical protein